MKAIWFIPLGRLHRPVSVAGWLVTVAASACLLQVFVAIDAHAHSVTHALYAVYPHWGVTFLGWDWIARRTSVAHNR
ncbi:MAG TPA: hypothetical protein VGH81_14255 [Rudaea sp.]|jgi:hypothetical protein